MQKVKNIRKVMFTMVMTKDEDEYITRKAHKFGLSKAEFLRLNSLKLNWLHELEDLKHEQRENTRNIYRKHEKA